MRKIIIDPSLSERQQSDNYYFTQFYCSNCGKPNGMYNGGIDVMVAKGKPIPKDKFECPNCECFTLSK